jgi:ABC-type sugar transport system ATPase subunit
LSLLGPSGCGKTTLLRCIAGLETPDAGVIMVGDQIVFSSESAINIKPGKRQLGMVFQSYALWPHMPVYENIGFGLWLQNVSRKDVRIQVDKVLQDLDMEGLGNRYPSELSGGQQQRVAVARLLATKPPVFLMDEPLSNLDARLRIDMRSELKRLHYELGVTAVYVTHDQTEAMTMSSRVVVMKEGRIHQIGPPQKIYTHPANLFVAEFVGMPLINTIPATIIRGDNRLRLQIDDFNIQIPWGPLQEEVTVTVRPENIHLFQEPAPDTVEFKVYAVLPAGPEVYIQARRGARTLMIRENHQLDLKMDQPVWIQIDTSALNFFDRENGMALKAIE